jgi:hypothetical protein
MAKTFAQSMNDAHLMTAALKTNLETLKRRGMTLDFIDQLERSLNTINAENSEQERLKADLKTITAKMTGHIKELSAQMQEAVKVVKLEIPQAHWKEFGIQAKR